MYNAATVIYEHVTCLQFSLNEIQAQKFKEKRNIFFIGKISFFSCASKRSEGYSIVIKFFA